jgi:glycosyltransferase involved in cell wall biosynthesis
LSDNKKILIIAHQWPPHGAVAALRIYKFAKHFKLHGFDIKILTTEKYFFDGHQKNIYPNIGCEVIYVNYGHFKNSHWEEKPKQPIDSNKYSLITSLLKQINQRIRQYSGSLFDIHDLAVSNACKLAIDLRKHWQYEMILSSYGPSFSHKVAFRLKKQFPNIYWLADFRDLWYGNHTLKLLKIFSIFEKLVEKRTIKLSNRIITVSEGLKKILKKRYPIKPVDIVKNYGELVELDLLKKTNNFKIERNVPLKIIYTGTIYKQQNFADVLKLLNKLENIELHLYGNFSKTILRYCKQYSFLKINGFIPRKRILQLQENADILLFLEWGDPNVNGILTGKLFEYLFSDTPILAIGKYYKESSQLIETTDRGKYCPDINSINNFIDEITQGNYRLDKTKLKKYTFESQISKLIIKM